ncbi:MAG TPA: hypothetical protein VGL08_19470, partial [Paraburkholderia sp.]
FDCCCTFFVTQKLLNRVLHANPRSEVELPQSRGALNVRVGVKVRPTGRNKPAMPRVASLWWRMIHTSYESFAPLFYRLRPPLASPLPTIALAIPGPDREVLVSLPDVSSVFPDSNEFFVSDLLQRLCHQGSNPCRT